MNRMPFHMLNILFAGMSPPPPVTIVENDITPRQVPRMSQAKRRRLMRRGGTTSAGKSRNRPRNHDHSRSLDNLVALHNQSVSIKEWNRMSKAQRQVIVAAAAMQKAA